ncbi:TPA: hypothetical protein NKP98_004052 [Vibrio parahaemolyticus]|nr:hypothetical protein [Vibrio parahaemolyticus]
MKKWIIKVNYPDGSYMYVSQPLSDGVYSGTSSHKIDAYVFDIKPDIDSIYFNGGKGELEEVL